MMLSLKQVSGDRNTKRAETKNRSKIYQVFVINQVVNHKLYKKYKFFNQPEFGLFNYVLVFLTGIILTAVLFETCGIVYVLPVSQCDLKLTPVQKGILTAISFFGVICSSHLWGFLADTKGRRCVIQPTLFVAFLLSCASSFAQNFYIFVTLRFLNGFL